VPILYACVVVDLIGVGIIIPLLPFYAQAYGASPLAISLLMAVFSAAQFLSAPVVGRLSDRFGRRPVFMACVTLSCIGYLGLAFADSLLFLFLTRALNGVGSGKISVANAIVADITAPADRAKRMGQLASAFGIGMILGPILGGFLSGDASAPDFHRPMFAAAGLSATAAVLALILVPESLPPEKRGRGAAPAGGGLASRLRLALADPHVMPIIATLFIFNFVFAQVITVNPLWLQALFNYGPRETGSIMGYIGMVLLVVQAAAISPLVKWLGERGLLLLGLTVFSAAMLLTPLAHTLPAYLAVSGLIAVGIAVTGPSSSALMSRSAPPDRQGAVLGAAQSAASLGQVLGPGLAGWLFGAISPATPYWIGGLVMAAVCLFAARTLPRRDPA
jgi:DHA1 family tetracycline resistance protein-like MFS transporter